MAPFERCGQWPISSTGRSVGDLRERSDQRSGVELRRPATAAWPGTTRQAAGLGTACTCRGAFRASTVSTDAPESRGTREQGLRILRRHSRRAGMNLKQWVVRARSLSSASGAPRLELTGWAGGQPFHWDCDKPRSGSRNRHSHRFMGKRCSKPSACEGNLPSGGRCV